MNRVVAVVVTLWLLLVCCIPLAQAKEWTGEEKGWATAAAALHVIDWGQTRHIAKSNGEFYEVNPVIGRHPSSGRVNGYFIASGLVIAGLAHFIPEYRRELLMLYVGVQTVNTARNFHIGLRVSF